MTRTETGQILAKLKASYPRTTISRETVELYVEAFEDVDFEQAMAATMRHIKTSKWFPTVSEICEEIANARLASVPEAEIAWGEVRKAIGRVGRYNLPEFSSPVVAATVEQVGWSTICNDEFEASTRKRFIDTYRQFRSGLKTALQHGSHSPHRRQLGERGSPQRAVFELPELGVDRD